MIQGDKLYLCCNSDTLDDPSYRYRISVPKFVTVDKKGTKITLFQNSKVFTDELEFDEKLLVTLMGKKLSCQTGYDKTIKCHYFKCANMRMNDVVCDIIQKYLICGSCDRPEVHLTASNNHITQHCKACGVKSVIENKSLNDNVFDTFYKFLVGVKP